MNWNSPSFASRLSFCIAMVALASCSASQGTFPNVAQTNLSPTLTGNGYKVLHSFRGGANDGSTPERHLLYVNGALYGTTFTGGLTCGSNGCGTIFSITTEGVEQLVYRFKGYPDGFYPEAGLTEVNGELYGTTTKGGIYNHGIVFKIDRYGVAHILHSFFKNGLYGAYPTAGLTDVNGVLYGTTHGGGTHNGGTIFKITTSGKETVLYAFGKPRFDGLYPSANLAALNGALYGTTTEGGKYKYTKCVHVSGCGTVFRVTLSGKETVLYDFRGASARDGEMPVSGLTYVNGTLYGTRLIGGDGRCDGHYTDPGCGVVFEISTSGSEAILHRFAAGADGADPIAGLAVVNGTLYGTTRMGGSNYCGIGCGTVFKITASGLETVIYAFTGNPDGQQPEGGLTYFGKMLYGTTTVGGKFCEGSFSTGCGTVFRIKP